MTRKEAIKTLQWYVDDAGISWEDFTEAFDMALNALRPITREKVEQVWRGEWIIQQDEHREFTKKCPKCGFPISGWWGADKFCANCGAPMTDEAVDMVMERLEALNDGESC